MNYFFHPTLDSSVSQFAFSPEESRHIVKVLRKKEGDLLHITNGKGYLFTSEITLADPKKCVGRVLDTKKTHPSRFELHLAVAPTKRLERFQWFLEKATEIGVSEITPIYCKRSERDKLSMERMQRVIQEAMKQSLRTYLPKLNKLTPVSEFLQSDLPDLRFIAHCEADEKVDLKRRVAPDKDIVILIGPEGDFSRPEIESAYEAGFLPVSLGRSRLRTETAAIVACATVNLINSA
ncbi:16S rRNA (uracil(1498)-N(3))-methyltransferase [Robiginitalea aurantiaca]|uniref:Ribosomal RNA small subunit methyltransferase E n=1 Tax=Robiginitalea aurantiaca TaxID=3056915 RepID=A0ABT7WI36_9FLAO|nr:16S rRNA (uracil(1498)-N(3))-methyltransferase [Robiginitalea aurantiaca]MDM9632584.1 16S rRNA (uracil(1498)-N(3))-methyltransferase [Robiginitalea aurantiaca]